MYGNKGLQINRQQNLSPTPERLSSDSDDGLPPPIPPKQSFSLKLRVDGLGPSTLALGNGKTAEQMADEQVLQQSIQQKKLINNQLDKNLEQDLQNQSMSQKSLKLEPQPAENVYTFADDDSSSDGLPPPIPVKSNPGFKLAIGGLGLSTLAKTEGGKTAEELADMEQVKISQNQNKQKIEKISEESSDSDDGLPPPVP